MTTEINKVALVTGAATGIGRAIAVRLAKDGIAVAVNYFGNSQEADEVVDEITNAGGIAIAFHADVSVVGEIIKLFNEVSAAFGGIDIVVANAGISLIGIPFVDVTEKDFDRINAVNYKGTYFVLQQAAKQVRDVHIRLLTKKRIKHFVLQQAAKQVRDGGRIIQISSSSSLYPAPGFGIYAPSKAAGKVVVEILSLELAQRKISVNSVFPGPIKTAAMLNEVPKEEMARINKNMNFGRMGEPEEIAGIVTFLAGAEGGWINGQQIIANGGGRI